MTVAELKALAKKKKVSLSAGGKKADIIKALTAVAKAVKPAAKRALLRKKGGHEGCRFPEKNSGEESGCRKNGDREGRDDRQGYDSEEGCCHDKIGDEESGCRKTRAQRFSKDRQGQRTS